jgi:hypothetical protein
VCLLSFYCTCGHFLVLIFYFATFLAHPKFYRQLTHYAFKIHIVKIYCTVSLVSDFLFRRKNPTKACKTNSPYLLIFLFPLLCFFFYSSKSILFFTEYLTMLSIDRFLELSFILRHYIRCYKNTLNQRYRYPRLL